MKKTPFFVLSLLIVGIGCSSHPVGQVTNTRVVSSQGLPSGWKVAEALGEHLSIGCPPEWKMRNVTGEQFEKNLERAGKQSAAAQAAADDGRRLERRNIYKII